MCIEFDKTSKSLIITFASSELFYSWRAKALAGHEKRQFLYTFIEKRLASNTLKAKKQTEIFLIFNIFDKTLC